MEMYDYTPNSLVRVDIQLVCNSILITILQRTEDQPIHVHTCGNHCEIPINASIMAKVCDSSLDIEAYWHTAFVLLDGVYTSA